MYWESKTMNDIAPSGLRLTIAHQEAFGWVLENMKMRDGLYSLTFVRDQSRYNYIQLVEAEYEYESVSYPKDPGVSIVLVLGIILTIIGLICLMTQIPFLVKILICMLGVGGVIWGGILTGKKKKIYKAEWSRVHNIKMAALAKGL